MSVTIEPAPAEQVLPMVPSVLLRLALEDLKKCERDPHYKVNMANFLRFEDDGQCAVCLAGAIMAQRLGGEMVLRRLIHEGMCGDSLYPVWMGENARQLRAIDFFRTGLITLGLRAMGLSTAWIEEERGMTMYERDPAAFRRNVRLLADDLEKAGL